MLLTQILLTLSLWSPAEIRAVADTGKAPPKPPPLAPTNPKGPSGDKGKPAPPKGKPVGEPELKRRKPPSLHFPSVG